MGNETGCPSSKNLGELGCPDVISPMSSPSKARRLSLEVISPNMGYPNVNMSPGVVRRLFICNKSCGFSKCKNET